jgi:hypothetical protein
MSKVDVLGEGVKKKECFALGGRSSMHNLLGDPAVAGARHHWYDADRTLDMANACRAAMTQNVLLHIRSSRNLYEFLRFDVRASLMDVLLNST